MSHIFRNVWTFGVSVSKNKTKRYLAVVADVIGFMTKEHLEVMTGFLGFKVAGIFQGDHQEGENYDKAER